MPEEGTVGTPVIDPVSGTIFVDTFTREVLAGVSTNYYHRVHALDVTTGIERPYSPVVVAGSVTGTGVNGHGGVSGAGTGVTLTDGGPTVTFSAIQECARPALTLAGGILYVAFGSHDDTDPYHGWVFGYNATNLSVATIYCTTPNARLSTFGSNAGEGAIWQGGNGLLVDAGTNLYFETGNGSFTANTNGGDYGDSFVKLSTASNKLAVADYFTPFNQASLQAGDVDLGSGGPLLLPDSVGSAAHPHLLVGCGKEGRIYLRDGDGGRGGRDADRVCARAAARALAGAEGTKLHERRVAWPPTRPHRQRDAAVAAALKLGVALGVIVVTVVAPLQWTGWFAGVLLLPDSCHRAERAFPVVPAEAVAGVVAVCAGGGAGQRAATGGARAVAGGGFARGVVPAHGDYGLEHHAVQPESCACSSPFAFRRCW